MNFTISRDSLVLAGMCVLDMLVTILLLAMGVAEEANPLMACCLGHGMAVFCFVKLGTVIPLVALAEWYRKHNPAFVKVVTRAGIAAYAVLYLGILLAVNVV